MINTITNVYRIYCDFATNTRPRYHPLSVKGVLMVVAAWLIICDNVGWISGASSTWHFGLITINRRLMRSL